MFKKIRQRYLKVIVDYLKLGGTPEKLALSTALGVVFGILPFFGVTTIILAFIVTRLRLNMIFTQLVNYSVYPLQVVLFIPFFKLGQVIFRGPLVNVTVQEFVFMLKNNFWDTFQKFWYSNLLAIIAWIIVSIPLSYLLYYLSRYIFKNTMKALRI